MAKYTYECKMGHEPMMMEVEAGNDEEAMEMMMDQCKNHMAENHSDMPMPSEDEMRSMISEGWTKHEGEGMDESSDEMGGEEAM